MKGTKLTIVADMAHFKNSRSAVLQQTYKIPPISTVIGILKNVYGENIEDFIFGYNFTYSSSQYEISTLYKELNMSVEKENKKGKRDYKFNENSEERFITFPSQIEFLINPKLEIIVIGLQNNYIMNTVLNLGKTNCLAKIKTEDIEIYSENSMSYNVLTDFQDGIGRIERQNIETVYNEDKGYFDYYTKLVRTNNEHECKYSYDESGIYLWKYNKVGDIECYKE